jgi:hypothetical protein
VPWYHGTLPLVVPWKRVLQLTHDLAAVAHFTAHDKHTLIRLLACASTSDQSTRNKSLASHTDQTPPKASTTQSQRPSLTL